MTDVNYFSLTTIKIPVFSNSWLKGHFNTKIAKIGDGPIFFY